MAIVVVGGGVAGLVAARCLVERGLRVVVLEASEVMGGALRSSALGPIAVDVGAEAFAVTRREALDLIDDLGLGDRVVPPRRSDSRILLDGGPFPVPHALLGIPTDLASPEVLAILGDSAVVDAIRQDSRPLPDFIDPQTTLGRLVRERMGSDVVSRIVTPIVGGVHAIDPDLVEADAVVPGLLGALRDQGSLARAAALLRSASGIPGSAVAGLQGGMTTLISALVDDLKQSGVAMSSSSPVTSIRSSGPGWSVQTPSSRIEASAVVLAVDAPQAAELIIGLPTVRDRLMQVRVGDVAVVSAIVTSRRLDDDPVGSGVLIPPGVRGIHAKAMTHATAKWSWIREAYGPGRHLVRLSYGRNGRIDEDLSRLPAIARTDLELICDTPIGDFDAVSVTRWAHSLVQQRVGHRANVAALRAAVAEHPSLAVAGAGIGGNGLAGTIAQARTVVEQLQDATLRT